MTMLQNVHERRAVAAFYKKYGGQRDVLEKLLVALVFGSLVICGLRCSFIEMVAVCFLHNCFGCFLSGFHKSRRRCGLTSVSSCVSDLFWIAVSLDPMVSASLAFWFYPKSGFFAGGGKCNSFLLALSSCSREVRIQGRIHN